MYRVELPQSEIDAIFENASHQQEYILELYNAVLDLGNVVEINDYPKVSHPTSDYIFEKAIAFDKEHHPDVLAGGAWMNRGFATDRDIGDWVVDVDEKRIVWAPDC